MTVLFRELADFKKYFLLKSAIILFIIINIPFFTHGLDGFHIWRQADTASIARNFAEESLNIFYPRIDVRSDSTGITGMEFPLYQYTVGIIYKITGLELERVGLGLSLIASFFVFYCLAKIEEEKSTGILLGLFSIPLFFSWSHRFMPENFGLAILCGALYLFYKRPGLRGISFILFALAVLIRPFYIFHCYPILSLAFLKLKRREVDFKLLVGGFFILICFFTWYYVWCPYLVKTYGIDYFYMGQSIRENLNKVFSLAFWTETIKMLFSHYFNLVLLIPFIHGLIHIIKNPNQIEKDILIASILLIFFLPILIGDHGIGHSYYFFALIPLFSLCIGRSIKESQKHFIWHLLVGALIAIVVYLVFLQKSSTILLGFLLPFIFISGNYFIHKLSLTSLKNPIRIILFYPIISAAALWAGEKIPYDAIKKSLLEIEPQVLSETGPEDKILTNDPHFSYAIFKLHRKGSQVTVEDIQRIRNSAAVREEYLRRGYRGLVYFENEKFSFLKF